MPTDKIKETRFRSDHVTAAVHESHDPILRADKIDSASDMKTLARGHESEIKKDTNLSRFDQSAAEIWHNPARDQHSCQSGKRLKPSLRVINAIRKKRLRDKLHAIIEQSKFSKEDLKILLEESEDLNLPEVFSHAIAERDLRAKKLWREKSRELTFSEVFAQKSDERFQGISRVLYNEGTFLDDSDITVDDQTADLSGMASDLPKLSVAGFYELMRPPPVTLERQIARRLAERNYFTQAQMDLYAATLLCSRNVQCPEHFIDILIGGLYHEFPFYTYQAYQRDLPRVKILLQQEMKTFFAGNRIIQKALRGGEKNSSDVWRRLQRAWKSLTAKQRHALEKIIKCENPLTYEQAANDFGISVDSLKDRVRGAIRRIRAEFSEFDHLKPEKKISALKSDLTLNGLWRISSAKKIHPLMTYDLKSGRQFIVSNPQTKPRVKKLSANEVARIKAFIYEAVPVPNICETEYFAGLWPDAIARDEVPKD